VDLLNLMRLQRPACLLAAALALTTGGPAAAQTTIKFSLDGRLEGLAATFFFPQDRGYFRTKGLDVVVDEATIALEPITRVASGAYEMGLADINTLIKYRDQHPSPAVRAVFVLYNNPPFAIVARKSRGITEPKQLEGKKLGAPPTGITVG
jgi:NitT/TauT family transport system substrate-binding protein